MVVKKFGFESQVAGKGIDQGAVVAAVDIAAATMGS